MSPATSIVIFLLGLSHSAFSLTGPCIQRSASDFRADANDCTVFRVCALGRLTTYTCTAGSVYNQETGSCVPKYSVFDTCSRRVSASQHCPPGQRGAVPHPTQCAQYYECGQPILRNRPGWEAEQRECPFPQVFSLTQKKCVFSSQGVCGDRQEPLDQCDYKQNECLHTGCIPCHVRFPSCRGRPDGLNAWQGRQGSPFHVTCHQQRVTSSGMCEQRGAVTLFDETRRECVQQTEVQVPQVPHSVHLNNPMPMMPQQGSRVLNANNIPNNFNRFQAGLVRLPSNQNSNLNLNQQSPYQNQNTNSNLNQNQQPPNQQTPNQNQYLLQNINSNLNQNQRRLYSNQYLHQNTNSNLNQIQQHPYQYELYANNNRNPFQNRNQQRG